MLLLIQHYCSCIYFIRGNSIQSQNQILHKLVTTRRSNTYANTKPHSFASYTLNSSTLCNIFCDSI